MQYFCQCAGGIGWVVVVAFLSLLRLMPMDWTWASMMCTYMHTYIHTRSDRVSRHGEAVFAWPMYGEGFLTMPVMATMDDSNSNTRRERQNAQSRFCSPRDSRQGGL